MFGKKKIDKLIEDIDRYFDLIDQSLLVFKDGVRNYLYSNNNDFNGNLEKMSALESEIDVLRREIENALYTQTALVRSRGDIMRLFEKTRNITDLLNDSLMQFEIETPYIPAELNSEFMKLTEFSTLAVEAVIPAAKSYFKAPETVPDKISRAYFYAQAESLHEYFNAKLAENFPELTQQERRLATLLRLGFSSKYIATLMNITPESVEISRYRLRQKLGLSKGDNLVNFIKSI